MGVNLNNNHICFKATFKKILRIDAKKSPISVLLTTVLHINSSVCTSLHQFPPAYVHLPVCGCYMHVFNQMRAVCHSCDAKPEGRVMLCTAWENPARLLRLKQTSVLKHHLELLHSSGWTERRAQTLSYPSDNACWMWVSLPFPFLSSSLSLSGWLLWYGLSRLFY